MDIQFQYPEALWLLLLVPLFLLMAFFYIRWKEKKVNQIGDSALVQKLYAFSFTKTYLKTGIVLTALALVCIATANPRKPDATEAQLRKGIDVAVVLDVSNSMLATDVTPSRLAAAKSAINGITNNLEDDRLSFIVFAGSAYVQVPLTFDKASVNDAVAAAQTGSAGAQGTSIADALTKGALALQQNEDRFKAIVLLTDGETHDENALQVAKQLATKGIMINTIGIGSVQGTTIKNADGTDKKDESGQTVISRLDEAILQQIAAASKGAYVHWQNSEATTAAVLQQFTGIEKKGVADASTINYQPLYLWVAAPALLLLLIELFIPDRKRSTI